MINPTWVKRFNQPPTRTASSRIIQSWDPGGDNHWSVCVTLLLQDHKHYLLHVLRDRMRYSMLVARAIARLLVGFPKGRGGDPRTRHGRSLPFSCRR